LFYHNAERAESLLWAALNSLIATYGEGHRKISKALAVKIIMKQMGVTEKTAVEYLIYMERPGSQIKMNYEEVWI
jgi:hypothetical protein